jgi:predicted molibdopterin-dependent oxidoreductase YjgC
VEGLVVVGDDVPAFHSSPAEARSALERLTALVVVDSFLTPTARLGHVVLPMAAFGETEGTITNGAGRVQRVRAWSSPPGVGKPGWEILGALLSRLGSACEAASAQRVFHSIRLAIPTYATINAAAVELPGGVMTPAGGEAASARSSEPVPESPAPGTHARRSVLMREGAFDWADDPLVTGSPTLRRAGASRRRLNPRGVVAMSPDDATALGVRQGWTIRLKSDRGEAETAVAVQPGVETGVLLVPFGFRDELRAVLGGTGMAEVEVARV